MLLKADKNKERQKRHLRVRNNIHGTAERPRLNVFRSLAHIYVQIIDDEKGVTLTETQSFDNLIWAADIKGEIKKVGATIAKKALAAGITEVDVDVVDLHSSALLSFFEAVHEAGLKF